jgi:hypothetical protein
MGFYGLQEMRGGDVTAPLIEFLYNQLNILSEKTFQFQTLPCQDIVLLGQHLALSLPQLRVAFQDRHNKWEAMNLLIADELEKRRNVGDPYFSSTPSPNDPPLSNVAKRAFKNSYITISSNRNLFGLYENEIMSNNLFSQISNPEYEHEVSKVIHKRDKVVRFCMSRDRLLNVQLNNVEKIGAKALRVIKEKELDLWVSKRIGGSRSQKDY